MIRVFALKAEYNPYFCYMSERFAGCSTKIDPIERNSLYAKVLIELCKASSQSYMNLSHSGIWCVCCCGDSPCGIDIEKKRNIPADMIPDGFSKSPPLFLKQWTRFESYIKYQKRGLTDYQNYDSLDFSGVVFKEFDQIEGYELCLCVKEGTAVSLDVCFIV